jgi:hypothetical protein
MRRLFAATLLFLFAAVLSTQAFSQANNATVAGTIDDGTGAVLPGVAVTATNNATGVITVVLSNEAGAYNFASLANCRAFKPKRTPMSCSAQASRCD